MALNVLRASRKPLASVTECFVSVREEKALLAAVSGTSHDRAAKILKAILAISVWRACTPQWIANLTILARNSRKDSKARSAANQPLPTDWSFCKRGLVIPRLFPTRFAQALIEESASKIKRAILAATRFPAPSFTKTPFIQLRECLVFFVGVT